MKTIDGYELSVINNYYVLVYKGKPVFKRKRYFSRGQSYYNIITGMILDYENLLFQAS